MKWNWNIEVPLEKIWHSLPPRYPSTFLKVFWISSEKLFSHSHPECERITLFHTRGWCDLSQSTYSIPLATVIWLGIRVNEMFARTSGKKKSLFFRNYRDILFLRCTSIIWRCKIYNCCSHFAIWKGNLEWQGALGMKLYLRGQSNVITLVTSSEPLAQGSTNPGFLSHVYPPLWLELIWVFCYLQPGESWRSEFPTCIEARSDDSQSVMQQEKYQYLHRWDIVLDLRSLGLAYHLNYWETWQKFL